MKIIAALTILFFSLTSFSYDMDFALEHDGTSSHVDGPNCWNGALVAAGVLESKRFIGPEEWLIHLEKNCSPIEEAKPGAVGRVFHSKDGEVHGFIHLDQETIFAKHGEDLQHGYRIMSYQEMMDQYGKTRSCRMSGDESPECHHEVVYYDCSKKASFHPALKKVATSIEELVFSEETKWFFKVTCEDPVFLKREELFNNVRNELLGLKYELENSSLLEEFKSNPVHKYFLQSLTHQLYNLEVSLRSFRCKDRKKRNQAVKAAKRLARELLNTF